MKAAGARPVAPTALPRPGVLAARFPCGRRLGLAILGALFAVAPPFDRNAAAQPAPPSATAARPTPAAPSPAVAYDVDVSLVPGSGLLRVTADVVLPAGTKAEFLLNGALKIVRAEPAVEEVPLGDVAAFFGNNAAAGGAFAARAR